MVTRPAVEALLADEELVTSIERALAAAGAPEGGVVVLTLSDDAELALLNQQHLRHEGPTDVLSFPLLPPEAFPPHPGGAARPQGAPAPTFVLPPGEPVSLGDIVVSVERAVEQAEGGRGGQTGDVRWSAADELRLLVTHGTLHLCGWDHADPDEEASMRRLEQTLLVSAGE